jgi:hypothetical protein
VNGKNTCMVMIAMQQWVRKLQTYISVADHWSLICSANILWWYFDLCTRISDVNHGSVRRTLLGSLLPSLQKWWPPRIRFKVCTSPGEQTT